MDILIQVLKGGGVFDFSTIDYGNMKIDSGDEKMALANRTAFIKENFPRHTSLRMAKVNHGTRVVMVGKKSRKKVYDADAILTKDRGVAVAVTFADCPPVLLFDRKKRIVGAIHCSYQTVLDDIIDKTLLVAMDGGVCLSDLLVIIGPGICGGCYEIGENVLHRYKGYGEFISRRDGRIFADLKGIIIRKFIDSNISRKNVFIYPKCTFCETGINGQPAYFSARRDKKRPPEVEAGLAAICMT